ncbi:sensor histidine kinase [Microbacterium sp. SORGH_AS_0888]|uniref:sensor histidine kinase n=1 Tax=Microbacterium sp. SORGH_AS_0888 TaxID=3041791 RepID=UPI00277F096B|nr:histidine kinase [Microbacterium sp. SORGH_AS_0888]MDQ1128746.1 signal transduction histidine kinase [Microbacterium sp. SORGH_AS_0888]
MPKRRSRSIDVARDDELRLPRAPGVIRQFWVRHPVFADVVIAALVVFFSLAPATAVTSGVQNAPGSQAVAPPTAVATGVLTLLACAALLLRRRWPVLVTACATVASLSLLLVPETIVSGPVLMVAIYAVPVYSSTRRAWTTFAAVCTALLAGALLAALLGSPVHTPLNVAINGIVSALLGVLVGVNIGNRKRYVEGIIDRSRQLLVERDQQAQLAAAAERTRIAREMHDIVSHSLTVIVALAEGATATADRERARAVTAQVADTARGALVEMRAMLGVLRDGDAEDAPLAPLVEDAVGTAVRAAQRAGFPVTLRTTGTTDGLPHAVLFALARVVQESLTNAMRHAPAATAIRVRVDGGAPGDDARSVTAEIVNDGARPASSAGGYGLQGLYERVAHVGGTIEAGPAGADEWRVRAVLPAGSERIGG